MFIDRDTQLTNGKVQFASYPLGRLVAERVEWRWRGVWNCIKATLQIILPCTPCTPNIKVR